MLTVLCIDDDRQTLMLRETILRAEGFHVFVSHTGAEGISLANQEKCDAVVLDYLMPDMCGENVARVLKHQHPELPVILCSGFSDIPESAFKIVDAFVSKGDLPEFLVATIKSVIARKKPSKRERRLDRSV